MRRRRGHLDGRRRARRRQRGQRAEHRHLGLRDGVQGGHPEHGQRADHARRARRGGSPGRGTRARRRPVGRGAHLRGPGRSEESSHDDRHHAVTYRPAPHRGRGQAMIGRPRAASVIVAGRRRGYGSRAEIRNGCAGRRRRGGSNGGERAGRRPGARRPGRARRRRRDRPDAVPGRDAPPRASRRWPSARPASGRCAASRRTQEQRDAEEQRSRTKRKRILIGAGVTVGVVALIAVGYAVAQPDEEVQAQCVDDDDVIVDDANCVTPAAAAAPTTAAGPASTRSSSGPAGGSTTTTTAAAGTVGDRVSGGTTTVPREGTRVRTTSGRTRDREHVGRQLGSSGAARAAAARSSRGGLGLVRRRLVERRLSVRRATGGAAPGLGADRARPGHGLRHARPRPGRRPAAVLGRVGALRVRDGRDPLPGGRRRGRALDVPAGGRPRGHHRAVPRLRAARVVLGGRRGVLAAQRPARLRPVRPALRRQRPGQAAGVQRRHPDHAARGVDPAVELAQGRPSRRRPVELAAREAGRALGRAEGPAARRRRLLHLVLRRLHRRGPRHRRLPAGDRGRGRAEHGRAGHRGRRLGRHPGPLRRPRRGADGRGVQALPLGVGARRRLRQARGAQPAGDALAGTAVEDAAEQQGAAGRALGDVPGPPQPAARLPRRARAAHRVRAQAAAGPGGRQHLDRGARLGDQTGGVYGEEGYVYQLFDPLPEFDGYRPALGAWIVGDTAAGLGIRETVGLVTDDGAAFVPHRIPARDTARSLEAP